MSFDRMREGYYELKDSCENNSSIFFKSFMKFLHDGSKDLFSAPPCQGVVINKEGKIKELSIKHPDHEYYIMGKPHKKRGFLNMK